MIANLQSLCYILLRSRNFIYTHRKEKSNKSSSHIANKSHSPHYTRTEACCQSGYNFKLFCGYLLDVFLLISKSLFPYGLL